MSKSRAVLGKAVQTWPLPRRRFLLTAGGAVGGIMLAGDKSSTALAEKVTHTACPETEYDQVQPFYGLHQPGVTTPRPAAGMMVAFDVVAPTPRRLETLLRTLTNRITVLMKGGPVEFPGRNPQLPPVDSGIMGPVVKPDNLTVTVGLGSSLFDDRPWLRRLKPRRLCRMTRFPNDAPNPNLCHGDLSLQICANTHMTINHALRDIVKATTPFMVPRWKQEGSLPMVPPNPDGPTPAARNLLGFHDGTANPDTADGALMNRIVWVGEDNDEPEWCRNGTYQVVRLIRMTVELWDRTPLVEQEVEVFGRRKASGSPLSGGAEYNDPDYSGDPKGKITPLDSHIRRANPRTPGSEANLILRRPYNYSNGVFKSGQLDQGLVLIIYQADLEQGFITVQNRLNGEELEEYIKPFGGGYYFVPPGVRKPGNYIGQPLMEAVAGP